MFNLSPKEDLLLLAAKQNHPSASWKQISELIFRQENYFLQGHQWDLLSSEQTIPEEFIFSYKQVRPKVGPISWVWPVWKTTGKG
jgi:hypothetical protein